MESVQKPIRRYDLDWLRVIAFSLLIVYHVGMFFVPWGWHIKNNEIYPGLRLPMAFINQWRLPLLFLISGMGTYYALSSRSASGFMFERVKRLLLPLLVGMLLVVPPQVYFERLDKGQFTGNYFEFWLSQAFVGVYPEGNLSWHHLWFLPYLLLFSLVLIPAFLKLRKHPGGWLFKKLLKLTAKPFGLFWMIIPLYLWESLLEPFFPSTHALIGDWFNLVNYLTFFFYGFLLLCTGDIFWKSVIENRKKYLLTGIIIFSIQAGIWFLLEDSVVVHFVEALVKVTNIWAWILALSGFAAAYLNRPGKALRYANEAVYPFYILHQTVTIAIGYYLMRQPWDFSLKFSLLLFGTFGISWLIYEFGIRRWKLIRPLFGLKNQKIIHRNKIPGS
jgi:glucans biosynthesis protein C